MDLVRGALAIDDQHKTELVEKAIQITGLTNPNSRNQLLTWINDNSDLKLEKLTKRNRGREPADCRGSSGRSTAYPTGFSKKQYF